MSSTVTTEHTWLLGEEAAHYLEQVAGETRQRAVLPAYVTALRRTLGPVRTSLVLEQVQLRERAREKFSHAEKLFFTGQGLEQATDEPLANYKAGKFLANVPVHDLCCGIGGDAFGFIGRGPVRLVDRDSLSLFYAQENTRRLGKEAEAICADVTTQSLPSGDAWHIDPDRRAAGKRTTRIELGAPGLETIARLLNSNPNAGVKLAPAAETPAEWSVHSEKEWIETRGECRQLMVWFGALTREWGRSTATVIDRKGIASSFSGASGKVFASAGLLGEYLFDPTPALLASRLLGDWSETQNLSVISTSSLYLTGEIPLASPFVQTFRVLDTLPLDISQLKSYFRERSVGRLEIKQRGVGLTPEALRPQLQLQGPNECVLILTEYETRKRAIICERWGEKLTAATDSAS